MFYHYHVKSIMRGRVVTLVVASLVIASLAAGCRKSEPTAEATATLALTSSVPLPVALPDLQDKPFDQAQDKPFDQAQGKVDVESYETYLKYTGSGAPALILEAGYDTAAETWLQTQPEAAWSMQVCSYDGAHVAVCENECLNTSRPSW